MTHQEKVEQYYRWVRAYENGTPEVSDAVFDIFEQEIKKIDKDALKKVAAGLTGTHHHLSPLLSLDKQHVYDASDLPLQEIKDWFGNKSVTLTGIYNSLLEKESSPKFDGNAISLQYSNGILKRALSRTDRLTGNDHYNKIKFLVPNEINNLGEVEIRGEMLIKSELFDKKYKKSETNPSGFSNERNYVTGVLKGNGLRMEKLKELDFVAYEIRQVVNGEIVHLPNQLKQLELVGFNPVFHVPFSDFDTEFGQVYNRFLHYKENECPWRLDGFVIKLPPAVRNDFGEKDKYPNWALAIKFPPEDGATQILSIESNVGITGELTPVAQLEPIDLDGSIVTKATLHNWGYVLEKNIKPNSKVVVAKAGDIIPQIYEVVHVPEEGDVFSMPEVCPSCGEKLTVDDIHLYCTNNHCKGKVVSKLTRGLSIFGVKKIGEKTVEKFYDAGIFEIYDIFDNVSNFSDYLINAGNFKEGRQLEIIVEAINKIKEVTFEQVIRALSIPGIGKSISKQAALKLINQPYDSTGLTKDLFEACTTKGTPEYDEIEYFTNILNNNGIKIKYPLAVTGSEKAINFEMTGTPPKIHGLNKKADYVKFLEGHGYTHTSLNSKCDLLLTDDMNSTTGKMGKAKKLNIDTITYEDLINKLLTNEGK